MPSDERRVLNDEQRAASGQDSHHQAGSRGADSADANAAVGAPMWKSTLYRDGANRASRSGVGNGRLLELTAAAGALTVTFVEALPKSLSFQELGRQLLSSGTSAEANYRAAKRARSPAEFVAKLKIVEEEADESMVWIDRIRTAKLPDALIPDAARLRDMFDQIVALTVESIKTTKARHLMPPPRRRKSS